MYADIIQYRSSQRQKLQKYLLWGQERPSSSVSSWKGRTNRKEKPFFSKSTKEFSSTIQINHKSIPWSSSHRELPQTARPSSDLSMVPSSLNQRSPSLASTINARGLIWAWMRSPCLTILSSAWVYSQVSKSKAELFQLTKVKVLSNIWSVVGKSCAN